VLKSLAPKIYPGKRADSSPAWTLTTAYRQSQAIRPANEEFRCLSMKQMG
jgi:hypothetical protein